MTEGGRCGLRVMILRHWSMRYWRQWLVSSALSPPSYEEDSDGREYPERNNTSNHTYTQSTSKFRSISHQESLWPNNDGSNLPPAMAPVLVLLLLELSPVLVGIDPPEPGEVSEDVVPVCVEDRLIVVIGVGVASGFATHDHVKRTPRCGLRPDLRPTELATASL